MSQKHILIVSLNTAIDRIIYLPSFETGKISRAKQVQEQAGGKAINVARALVALGHKVQVIGFAGGFTGQHIKADLLTSNIPSSLINISGNSRSCYIFVDEIKKQETVVNEPGPIITEKEFQSFCQELSQHIKEAKMLICSGSLPRGIPFTCYQQFVNLGHSYKIPVLVDATGETLKLAVSAKPYLIKPNREEAETLLGKQINDSEAIEVAKEIYNFGLELGLISLGSQGAVGVWKTGEIFVAAPKINAINSVACGDAFLAGCASAILAGKSSEEIIISGVAAGSANALVGGARISLATFEELKQELRKKHNV